MCDSVFQCLKKTDKVVFSNDNIVFVNTYFSDCINTIDLDDINLNDNNFDDDHPETIIVRFMLKKIQAKN